MYNKSSFFKLYKTCKLLHESARIIESTGLLLGARLTYVVDLMRLRVLVMLLVMLGVW